jgi:uncharacterized protein
MVKDLLRLGEFSAAPGESAAGNIALPVAGQTVQMPFFLINGASEGPTLTITAGVHGAEYASIAAALELGQTLSPSAVRGQVIVLPVVDPPSFRQRSIYVCPWDGVNPNRVFPGRQDGSAAEQLAFWVYNEGIKRADYFVDMHGGDLIEALAPFSIFYRSGDPQVDQQAQRLAEVFGIYYVVSNEVQGSTFAAAARAGIPAVLVEAGGQGIWPRVEVERLVTGVRRLMTHVGMLAGPAPEPLPFKILENFPWLRSEHEGYYYPQVAVGDMVTAGQELGFITDHTGQVLQRAVAPCDGAVLFVVSSLAINRGDPLLAIGA